jgi:hypothetical protein
MYYVDIGFSAKSNRARICKPFKEPRNRFPARIHRLAEKLRNRIHQAGNRFLGPLNYVLRLLAIRPGFKSVIP